MAASSEVLTSHRAVAEALARAGGGATLFVAGDPKRPGSRLAEIVDRARDAGVPIRMVDRRELKRIAPEAHDCALELPAGEARGASLPSVLSASDERTGLILVLDHVTDPQNYGAILRSADQFAVDAVVVAGRRSAPLSAATIQASAGTADHVTIVTVANLASAIGEMQGAGFWVYAARMDGEPLHRTRLDGRTALIMGSEGKGVSRLVGERADAAVSIPTRGHADSLNVSVACGVVLYEVRRQQGWFDI